MTQELINSKFYKEYFENFFNINESYEHVGIEDIKKHPSVVYFTLLSKGPPIYAPRLFGDTIIAGTVESFFSLIIPILNVKLNRILTSDEIFKFYEWIIIKLNNFDNLDNDFIPAEKEFYIKLKKLKW